MPQDYTPWEPAAAWDVPTFDPTDPINADLVSFWPLSEGRNGVITTRDIRGINHGTLNNYSGYPWVSGISGRGGMGQALPFNGSNQSINVGNAASLNISGRISMSAWVNVAAFPTGSNFAQIIAKQFNGTVPWYMDLSGSAPTILRGGSFGGGGNAAAWSITGWGINEWHHVGVAYGTDSTWRLYFDGIQVATNNTGGALADANRVTIGAFDNAGTYQRFWNGKLALVRVHRRGLTPGDFRRLFLEPSAGVYHSGPLPDDYTPQLAADFVPFTPWPQLGPTLAQ